MDNRKLTSIFEITGSVLAMVYALLIASNTGNETIGSTLLLFSASLFSAWPVIDHRRTLFLLTVSYPASALLGLIRSVWPSIPSLRLHPISSPLTATPRDQNEVKLIANRFAVDESLHEIRAPEF